MCSSSALTLLRPSVHDPTIPFNVFLFCPNIAPPFCSRSNHSVQRVPLPPYHCSALLFTIQPFRSMCSSSALTLLRPSVHDPTIPFNMFLFCPNIAPPFCSQSNHSVQCVPLLP